MKIALNKAHFPVTVLGPGQRIGIWLQGCSIHCRHCISQDTWVRGPQHDTTVARLMSWSRKITADSRVDGITISGGEPFDQPRPLQALLDALHAWRNQCSRHFDILCYSGYPYAVLQQRHRTILEKLDALISEPYVDGQPYTHLWRGSSNQQLIPLSNLGAQVYDEYLERLLTPAEKRMQVCVDGKRVWFIGIPDRNDLPQASQHCEERGVRLGEMSWESPLRA